MPRQAGVEYEGAIYHVMARGDHRKKIVQDDEDSRRFEATLGEVIERMGWILYAYVLMGNHYHLVFKTPEANLVKGMTWFQGTVTKRYNARHRQRGHLFSGRYKAVLVEENDYLTTLVHYVHLNPIRAKLVRITDGIESYPWSSLADYTRPPSKRREWLSVEAGLLHIGYPDSAEGRRQFLVSTESLIDRSRLVRAGIVEMQGAGLNTTLRRGWCFGSDEFKEKMSDKLGAMIPEGGYKLENGYCGKQLRDHGERAAREWIRVGLDVMGLELADLEGMRKMDMSKAMLSSLLRRHTSMGLDWISRVKNGVRQRNGAFLLYLSTFLMIFSSHAPPS